MKYKAFISYRHTENGRRHAQALEKALKRYAKPTLAFPMKIFRDEKHVKPGSLSEQISEGLENSEYLIFLAEKASANSHWCQKELEDWCHPNRLNRVDRLIIILIDDEIELDGINHILWAKTTALPSSLQPYLTSIPLYVDFRWVKIATNTDLQDPKYRHDINAITARLRGVNPEDLNDEEIRVYWRNIRLRNGAIGVLLAMLIVLAGATFWALKQTKVANIKRLEANIESMSYRNPSAALTAAKELWKTNPSDQLIKTVSRILLDSTIAFYERSITAPNFSHIYFNDQDNTFIGIEKDSIYNCLSIVSKTGRPISKYLDTCEIIESSLQVFSNSMVYANVCGQFKEISFDGELVDIGYFYLSEPYFESVESVSSSGSQVVAARLASGEGSFLTEGEYIIAEIDGKVHHAMFSKNEQFLCVEHLQHITLFEKGKIILELPITQQKIVTTVAIDSEGELFAAGFDNGEIIIWYRNGVMFKRLNGHYQSIIGLSFTDDSSYFTSISSDGLVRLWNLELGNDIVQKFSGEVEMIGFLNSKLIVRKTNFDGESYRFDTFYYSFPYSIGEPELFHSNLKFYEPTFSNSFYLLGVDTLSISSKLSNKKYSPIIRARNRKDESIINFGLGIDGYFSPSGDYILLAVAPTESQAPAERIWYLIQSPWFALKQIKTPKLNDLEKIEFGIE